MAYKRKASNPWPEIRQQVQGLALTSPSAEALGWFQALSQSGFSQKVGMTCVLVALTFWTTLGS